MIAYALALLLAAGPAGAGADEHLLVGAQHFIQPNVAHLQRHFVLRRPGAEEGGFAKARGS